MIDGVTNHVGDINGNANENKKHNTNDDFDENKMTNRKDDKVVIDLTDESKSPVNRGVVGSFIEGSIRLTQSSIDSYDIDKISFAEIIQNKDELRGNLVLKKAFLSSYVMDMEWLLEELNGVETLVFCCDDRQHNSCARIKTTCLPDKRSITMITPPFPDEPSYGVMHCKLMLLHYEERSSSQKFLRIVISTGNLVPYDYDKVQNIIFIQDIPRDLEKPEEHFKGHFIEDLLDLLKGLKVESDIYGADDLAGFDFEAISGFLVFSNPGKFSSSCDEGCDGTGLLMLEEKFQDAQFGPISRIEYVCSSLGLIDGKWLDEFAAICGISQDYGRSCSKISSKRHITPTLEQGLQIQIVYPTCAYVENSPDGVGAFGTLFLRSAMWNRSGSPRHLFYRAESVFGEGQPIHAKILTGYSDKDDNQPSWVFIGSHNFTPSAWGKLTPGGITIANFEVGILLPWSSTKPFPFPYKRPLVGYASDDQPWMQDLFYGDYYYKA